MDVPYSPLETVILFGGELALALALALVFCKAQALDRALAPQNKAIRLDDEASSLARDRPHGPKKLSPSQPGPDCPVMNQGLAPTGYGRVP